MNTIYILSAKTDAYVFVKKIAAEKYNIDAELLEIERNIHGKPFFKNLPEFHFNLSHSGDLQAVAVSEDCVGIDIEKRRSPDLRIAKRFCSDELAYIMETDNEKRFFEIWTRKEALLKHKGLGITGGLNSFSVLSSEVSINTFIIGDYTLSVCSDKNFDIVNLLEHK